MERAQERSGCRGERQGWVVTLGLVAVASLVSGLTVLSVGAEDARVYPPDAPDALTAVEVYAAEIPLPGPNDVPVKLQPANGRAKSTSCAWMDSFQVSGLDGTVHAMVVHDDGTGPALYVAGAGITAAGGQPVSDVARWDGSSWSSLSENVDGEVFALVVLESGADQVLYAGGTLPGGNVRQWDGTSWSSLGTGVSSTVLSLAVFDDGIGQALYAGSSNGVERWNGSSWSLIGTTSDGAVDALMVIDDGSGPALFAAGSFSAIAGGAAGSIARWDGTSWTSVGTGMNDAVTALAVFDSDDSGPSLYAAGLFTTAGGIAASHIARWDGASWSALGSGLDVAADALAVFDDGSGPALYAGGGFTNAGGSPAQHIARWDGTSWSVLGPGLDGDVLALAVYDSGSGPELNAGGAFVQAGGLASSRIAGWSCTCDCSLELQAPQWAIFALPCVPSSATLQDVLGDDLDISMQEIRWSVQEWDAANTVYRRVQPGDQLQPGVGYWIISLDPATIDVAGGRTSTVCPSSSQYTQCFDIPLIGRPGGTPNMVGHPYQSPVPWSEVRIVDSTGTEYTVAAADEAGLILRTMHQWNGGGYDPHDGETPGMEGSLLGFTGFWVKALQDVTLRFPTAAELAASPTTSEPVMVQYSTAAVSAEAGVDYEDTTGLLVFPPGATRRTFTVPILDDSEAEQDETVSLTLHSPSNAQLGTSSAVLTILDTDLDPEPRAVISSPADGTMLSGDELVAINGSASNVPPGFQVWLGALVEGSPPMTLAWSGDILQGSFVPSLKVRSYLLRLVIAEPGSFPDESELLGASLPCIDTAVCDSTEVRIVQPYGFEKVYSYPHATLLRWRAADSPTIESSDYSTWETPICAAKHSYYFIDYYNTSCDSSMVPARDGTYYRMKAAGDSEWSYLGGWAEPGMPVARPSWGAPSVLPRLDADDGISAITWQVPDGATMFDATGTLTLHLTPLNVEGASLSQCNIKVFLNEETFDITDGIGNEIPDIPIGFDQPGCVVRELDHDAEVTVARKDDDAVVVIEGIEYGANSLRLSITDANDAVEERALLAVLHEDLTDGSYADLMPLLFGSVLGQSEPVIRGMGPVSRRSPDCGDKDRSRDPEVQDQAALYWAVLVQGMPDGDDIRVPIISDINGRWQAQLAPIADSTIELAIESDLCDGSNLLVGRAITDPVVWSLSRYHGARRTICGRSNLEPQTLQLVPTAVNPPPTLSNVPTEAYIYPMPRRAEVIERRLDLRVLDSYHDVDLASMWVTNQTLDPPVTVPLYYAAEQLREAGDWGWVVATVPLQAPGDNQLLIEIADLAGNITSETQVVTMREPYVFAAIASPADGSAWRSHEYLSLDGSTSIGPAPLEARWVFFSGDSGEALPELEQTGLTSEVVMPHGYGGLRARLVVVESGWLPADLYTGELPCSIAAGDGKCDAVEISLANACCPSPEPEVCYGDDASDLQLNVLAPSSGTFLPHDEQLTLQAQMSGGSGSYAYRWWVAPADDPDAKVILTPRAANGTDYGAEFATWQLDPKAAGLAVGDYSVTVEAGHIEGTEGCIASLRTASVWIGIGHVVSAVAPGQALAGTTVRVYGSTFTPGEPVTILVDDNPGSGGPPYEMTVTPGEDRSVDILLPAEMAAAVYQVAAASADGSAQSDWVPALEVVSPAYQIDGSDDPDCTGSGGEAVIQIVPGQTVTGDWCSSGDSDTFFFTAAAGTTVDLTLQRVDKSLSRHHPDAADPELLVVDPDGIIDALYGYANDVSAEDSDADLVGFVAPKSGVYGVICRTITGAGAYTLSLQRTGQVNAAGFGVEPYGPAAVNVVGEVGVASSTTFNAIVFDPRGLPAGGAIATWTAREGSASQTQQLYSHGSGIASGVITLDAGSSATVEPAFEWPFPAKATQDETYKPKPAMSVPASSGALLGVHRFDVWSAAPKVDLPGPGTIQQIRSQAERVLPLQRDHQAADPGKVLSACSNPVDSSQVITEVQKPAGAESITSYTFELTHPDGTPLDLSLPGLTVTEQHDLQVRLLVDCLDENGQPFTASLPGASISLLSATAREANAGGIVEAGGGVCAGARVFALDELTPFSHEVGKRATLTYIDDADQPHFAFTELLSASTVIKIGSQTELSGSAAVEVEPQHGDPNTIHWLEPQVLHESSTGVYLFSANDPPSPVPGEDLVDGFYVEGPQLYLLDAQGNTTPLWGRNDSRWHREQASDQIFINNPTTWGLPPFTGLRDRLGIYQPWVFVNTNLAGWPEHEDVTREVCVNVGEGDPQFICDTFTVNDTYEQSIINLQPPWPRDCDLILEGGGGCNNGGYVSDEEATASGRTNPGQPLLFQPSGKLILMRVHPVSTDDLAQPHSKPFEDIPVRVWVSGPSDSWDGLSLEQEDAGEPLEISRTSDVELCTGLLVMSADGSITGTCDTLHQGVATLDASTDTVDPADPGAGGRLGNVVGITRAPTEPGWYSVVAESNDSRFTGPNQRRLQKGWKFLVTSGLFLDEDYEPINALHLVPGPRKVYLKAMLPATEETVEVPVISAVFGETVDQTVVSLSRVSSSAPSGAYLGSLVVSPVGGSSTYLDVVETSKLIAGQTGSEVASMDALPLDIKVESLQFNHDPLSGDSDAINIRLRNEAGTAVIEPEYEYTENAQVDPPEVIETRFPIVYVQGRTVTIKATFRARSDKAFTLAIRARSTDSAGVLGDVTERVVSFLDGVSVGDETSSHGVELAIEAPVPSQLAKTTEEWDWEVTTINGKPLVEASTVHTTTGHEVFILVGDPVLPWEQQEPAQPWVNAIDYVITRIGPIEADPSLLSKQAFESLAQFLFSNSQKHYDYKYGASWFFEYPNSFRLNDFMTVDYRANCHDLSAALSILSSLIGIESTILVWNRFGYINSTYLVGTAGISNNPLWGRTDPYAGPCPIGDGCPWASEQYIEQFFVVEEGQYDHRFNSEGEARTLFTNHSCNILDDEPDTVIKIYDATSGPLLSICLEDYAFASIDDHPSAVVGNSYCALNEDGTIDYSVLNYERTIDHVQ